MLYFVYKLNNTRNNKTYIGVSSNPKKQISNHLSGNGSRLIHEDIEKHGREVFYSQILGSEEDETEAFKKMQILIMREDALYPSGYNLTIGGHGSKGSLWNGKQRAKMTGSRNHQSKLTETDVIAIFWDPRSRNTIATQYGISKTLVTNIKKGRAWKHITQVHQ